MQGAEAPRRRIYLDNGATSWPKPERVYQAVERYQRTVGAAAGRSSYTEAVAVAQEVDRARAAIASCVGLRQASRLVFAFNGTDALNMAIHGLLRAGDHVVTTVVEHNSVLRPLAELVADGRVEVTYVGCDAQGLIDPDDVRRALQRRTRLVAICHASNVTGAVQPVAAVGRAARESGAIVLCDAAQSLGHMPVDMEALHVDLVASSGHKGLLGPLGTGLLAIGPKAADQLVSVRQGGTGTHSDDTRQPRELPERLESGNLNVPGILGLRAGVEYLGERGLAALEREGRALTERLWTGLSAIGGVRLLGPPSADARVPLVSAIVEGYDPQEVALVLDAAHGIQVRAGLHCAPLMHSALGTLEHGGTVRFSLGAFNTADDVDAAVRAMEQVATSELLH